VASGDFNGDGNADLVMGALLADGPGNNRVNSGEAALIPGPLLPGTVIDLATAPANVTFFAGPNASAIGGDGVLLFDIDGDDKDELFIASPSANPGGRVRAGTVTIIAGTDRPLPRLVDLATVSPPLAPLVVEGKSGGDILAYSVAAGDVDGDGVTDAVFNGMGADGFGDLLPGAGEAYVLSGMQMAKAYATPTPSPTPTQEPSPTPTATMLPPRCSGDCNMDGMVTIDEIYRGINVLLGLAALELCPSMDMNFDGQVTVEELIVAVNIALADCPA
jgi:hypothetical protein